MVNSVRAHALRSQKSGVATYMYNICTYLGKKAQIWHMYLKNVCTTVNMWEIKVLYLHTTILYGVFDSGTCGPQTIVIADIVICCVVFTVNHFNSF